MNKLEKAEVERKKLRALQTVKNILANNKKGWRKVKEHVDWYQNDHALVVLYLVIPFVYVGYFGYGKIYGPRTRREIKKLLLDIPGLVR